MDKEEIKKSAVKGTSTVAGAAVGVVIGAAVSPNKAEAQEVAPDHATQHTDVASKPDVETQTEPKTDLETQPASHTETETTVTVEAPMEHQPTSRQESVTNSEGASSHATGADSGQTTPTEGNALQEPGNQGQGSQETEPEVEVIGYDRVTDNDGNEMDLAVLSVNGNEVGVFDVDLDGEADVVMYDANQNGTIDNEEVMVIHDQGVSMQPFQEAAGYDPQFAQNDLPDYVNDAEVDTFMA